MSKHYYEIQREIPTIQLMLFYSRDNYVKCEAILVWSVMNINLLKRFPYIGPQKTSIFNSVKTRPILTIFGRQNSKEI